MGSLRACGMKRVFRSPERVTFALGGKSNQKRHLNLRFKNPPTLFSLQICGLFPRGRGNCLVSFRVTNRLSSRAAAAHVITGRTNSVVRYWHERQPQIRTIHSAPGSEGTRGSFRCFCLLLSLLTKVGRARKRETSPHTPLSSTSGMDGLTMSAQWVNCSFVGA